MCRTWLSLLFPLMSGGPSFTVGVRWHHVAFLISLVLRQQTPSLSMVQIITGARGAVLADATQQ